MAVPQSRFVGTDGADQSAAQWWEPAAKLTDTSGTVPTMGREDGRPRRRTLPGDDFALTMPPYPTGAHVYDMDPDTWGRVEASSSVGKAYNRYVRRAANTSVDVAFQCETCGRYHGSATSHACKAPVP